MTDSLLSWPVTPAAIELDELIATCLTGAAQQEVAYQAVYDQYAGLIYRLCFSLLQHREDAEEVLQDTFEYAFRRLDQFDRRKAGFKTWLYQIAISRCRNKRRRKWLPTLPFSQEAAGLELTDRTAPAPEEVALLNDRQQRVWQALGQLSPKLRETAVLRYYEGLTYAEIGQILAIPAKTVESRMRLAHKDLRSQLAGEFAEVEL
jgi:RNA polymerase sigma-70 factor (ECF subfamily)